MYGLGSGFRKSTRPDGSFGRPPSVIPKHSAWPKRVPINGMVRLFNSQEELTEALKEQGSN